MSGLAAEVLANLRGRLEGFQEHLPLIKALRNPGLRDRHWDKISQSKPCPYVFTLTIHSKGTSKQCMSKL